MIKYEDIVWCRYANEQEQNEIMFKLKKHKNIKLNKQFIINFKEAYKDLEQECINFNIKNKNKIGLKRETKIIELDSSQLICDKCKTKLNYWKTDYDDILGKFDIFRCGNWSKFGNGCEGCFKKNKYIDYNFNNIPSIMENPAYSWKDNIINKLKLKNIFIEKKNILDIINQLKLPSLYSKYIDEKNQVYKNLNKRTKKNEKIIFNELKKKYNNIKYQQMILYKLNDNIKRFKIPDFILEKESLVIDEKKTYPDKEQINSYMNLLKFIHNREFFGWFIIEDWDYKYDKYYENNNFRIIKLNDFLQRGLNKNLFCY